MKIISQMALFVIVFIIWSTSIFSKDNSNRLISSIFSFQDNQQVLTFKQLTIPPRPSDAIGGSQFMASIESLSFEAREDRIFEEISKGNIPNFLRSMTKIESIFTDANGTSYSVIYEVMPDYLAVGSDDDFCRVPMGPITAQKIADLFGASMPTSKLVDDIYVSSDVKLEPITYPWSDESVTVPKFVMHNSDIETARIAIGGELSELTGGLKKDVILSNKIADPLRTHHVTIYGWHRLSGVPIQPVYNGHIDIYVDYSHGIRLLNREVFIDSVVSDYTDILMDEVLYKIFSNEAGPMYQPSYIKTPGIPEKPKSFGIINYGSDKLKIIINKSEAESYKIYLSNDGINFNEPISADPDSLIISDLTEDSSYYIKLKAVSEAGDSPYSEVLSGVPSSNTIMDILIVNGFDRSSTGNTYNFVRQHASAFIENSKHFNSATNDAVLDGLFNLGDYYLVDYILGEESTADESFSYSEQIIVANYLKNGGNLFVSGAEIAWDLDFKGNSTDKNFIWNYLKVEYADDAPFNTSNTYYNIFVAPNDFISEIDPFSFDNGLHGTYNVDWPDVFFSKNGGNGFLKYEGLNIENQFAAVIYNGVFPNGTNPGKIITMGFPFETIYPESIRNEFMGKVVSFFYSISEVKNSGLSTLPSTFNLEQNYPNPFNPTTTINYVIPIVETRRGVTSHITLKVYDTLGRRVATLVNEEQTPGNYSVKFDASDITSGLYFYKLQIYQTGLGRSFVESKKMILIK